MLLACQQKKAKEIKIVDAVPDNFQMYKKSEMAALMRMMLSKNEELRKRIVKGDSIGEFDNQYTKIHTATLTDSSDLDETYTAFANHFLQMQSAVFTVSKQQRKKQFNRSVNACITCHKAKCSGPIPRIEKLRID